MATRSSKLYIVGAGGFTYTTGDTFFKMLVKNQGGTLVKRIEISGLQGSMSLQADYEFRLPTTGKTMLLTDLPHGGNYRLAFEFYVDDAGNLAVKPTLKQVSEEGVLKTFGI